MDGIDVRRVAVGALVRIDEGGAYANLVTNRMLSESGLDERDRHFVTDLVYGTTRMLRACDHLFSRHLKGGVSPTVRAALRVGTYQLAFAGVAPHAAVAATVGAAPKPARGLVNAVLRRVSEDVERGIRWPDDATRLSYPSWIIEALTESMGAGAVPALEAMNLPATTHVRDDGYVQDLASQRVVASVETGPGQLVLDCCAAPGGKATAMAATGADVVASDVALRRGRLIVDNVEALRRRDLETDDASSRGRISVVIADAGAAPFPTSTFDAVLADAPCSGLGVLRRRPDARWRIEPGAVRRLADVQVTILEEVAPLVRPGGILVYSVCTLTREETHGVVERVRLPEAFVKIDDELMAPDIESDGMYVARWRRGS